MKSTFLKVMGIIMVVFGSLGIIGSILTLAMFEAIGFTQIGMMSIGQAVFMLAIGIIGILYSGNKDKARFCVICALFLIVLEIAGVILQYVSGYMALTKTAMQIIGSSSSTILTTLLGFVIPVLFFIAAYRFKKMSETADKIE